MKDEQVRVALEHSLLFVNSRIQSLPDGQEPMCYMECLLSSLLGMHYETMAMGPGQFKEADGALGRIFEMFTDNMAEKGIEISVQVVRKE